MIARRKLAGSLRCAIEGGQQLRLSEERQQLSRQIFENDVTSTQPKTPTQRDAKCVEGPRNNAAKTLIFRTFLK